MNEIFVKALPVLKKIELHGFEAVFVGGSVRDDLLQRNIHDVDIATSATPEEVKNIFPKTIDVGIQHGTVMVLENGETYEITTYRSESEYVDFRKPKEVTFIRSLKEDLQRRDFTMNAIAMNTSGQIIDYFHGQQAIANQVIETVGKADERFTEDALRMMRAVRFVSQLGFTCSDQTIVALKRNRELLQNISIERILVEFDKLLHGIKVQDGLRLLLDTGLYVFLPGLQSKEKELAHVAALDLKQLYSLEEKWATLLHFTSSLCDIENLLRQWKMPIKRIRRIQSILRLLQDEQDDCQDKVVLYRNGLETCLCVNRIQNLLAGREINENEAVIQQVWDTLPIQQASQLAVNGTHILQWTKKAKGPWIRDILSIITEKVINEEIPNELDAIKKEVIQCNLI